MRALLLHNPTAGTGNPGKADILAALTLAGFSARYVSSKDKRAVEEGLNGAADLLVVAGGDGTVRHAITHLPDRGRPVALVPLGTANNVPRSLGISGSPHELTERWQVERTRSFDTGTITHNGDTAEFTEGFGIGIVADAMLRDKKDKKRDGAAKLLHGRALLREALNAAAVLDATVTVDGVAIEGDLLGVEVLNVSFTGPSLPLAPRADPGDGLLDVICIARDQRPALAEWIGRPHATPPPVVTHRGHRIEIAWRNAPSRVDDMAGKSDGEQRATVTLGGAPVRIVMPAPDAAVTTREGTP